MDVSTMHTAVKLELDKTSALELPAFEPEEIDFWLNEAVESFILKNVEDFEKDQKAIENLRTLIVETTLTPAAGTAKPTSYVATLPATYKYRVGEEVTIFYTDALGSAQTARQGVTECTVDRYPIMIENPFSEHKLHYGKAKPLRMFIGNTVELVTDGNYSVTYYYLRYIKEQATISLSGSISCDLPVVTHRKIVKIAVNKMLENIGDERYQTQSAEIRSID